MASRALVASLIVAVAAALRPPTPLAVARRSWARRAPAAVSCSLSSKVPSRALPRIYLGAAAACAWRAARAPTRAEAAVCATTALLAAVDLGPTAETQVVSSRLAMRITEPETSGAAAVKRSAAEAWRGAVRLKIGGQLAGLFTLAVGGFVYRGAALALAANCAFWAVGAGANRHDATGARTPVPPGLVRVIASIDVAVAAAAYYASVSPLRSPRRSLGATAVVVGMAFGILEKLPGAAARLLGGHRKSD